MKYLFKSYFLEGKNFHFAGWNIFLMTKVHVVKDYLLFKIYFHLQSILFFSTIFDY